LSRIGAARYGHRSGLFQVAYALWREHRSPQPALGELRALLDWFDENQAGLATHELTTTRPGYVVWEDKHQVVALPFADTPC
jgi:hypothetical protein